MYPAEIRSPAFFLLHVGKRNTAEDMCLSVVDSKCHPTAPGKATAASTVRLDAAPATVAEGRPTKHQGHRINRILRNRAATADPKIRHRFYKNDTDVSRITSDTDPVNWHVVAQDRTT